MPAFEALMSTAEIEQVIDYMIFLSMRGETEHGLIDEATIADEKRRRAPCERHGRGSWPRSSSTSGRTPRPGRQPAGPPAAVDRESILRGRELFLGERRAGTRSNAPVPRPAGDGQRPSFVGPEIFNDVVFGGKISSAFKLTSGQLRSSRC